MQSSTKWIIGALAAFGLSAVAAVWIGDTRTGGETYLYLAVPALTLTFLASVTARGSVWLGWRSDRRVWRDRERSIRHTSSAAGLLSDPGRRLTSEDSPLPDWIRAEPRVWHFAPLVLLVLWTLVALFRAS